MFDRHLGAAAWRWTIDQVECVEPITIGYIFREIEPAASAIQGRASSLFSNHAQLEHKENIVASAERQRSIKRGISSTKLHGRWRLSSWVESMPSHASFTAPVEPGSAKI